MGAMAAELSPTSDYVDVVMKGGDVPDYTGTGSDLLTFLQGRPGYSPLAGTSMDTTGGSIAKNKEIANGLFEETKEKPSDADIEVTQGGTFWLALKLDGSHLTSGGVGCAAKSTGMSFIIAYNSGFTLLGSSATPFVTDNGIYNSGFASMITGLTPSDKSRYTISTSENVTTFPSYAADKYGKSVTVQMAPSSSLTQAYYLPAEAEWDCLMKFQVGDTMEAGKVYNFSYVEEYNTTAVSTIFVNRGPQEGTEDILELKPSVSGPAEHIKTTNFKVKVKEAPKPGITAKGVAGGNTITVAANDYCTLGAPDPSHWTVKSGTTDGTGGTAETVSSATASGANIQLTLTNALTAGTDYYVEADAAAIVATPAATNPVKTTFQPGVKPAATYSIDTDGKVTLSNATGCEYRVGTSGNFSPVSSTAFAIADTTNTSNPSVTVQVQKTGNTDATLIQSITIDRADVPGNYTINYTGETLKFAGNVQYKIGTTGSVESGSTAEKTITPGAAAQSFTYWTAPVTGANGKLKSAIKSGSIPKRPDNNAALGTTSDTQKEHGQTVLGTAAAGTKYFIDTVADTTTVPGTGVENWATGAIDATTAKWIHAYIPATATAFKSEFKHLKGVGFDYGTVTASGASEGTTITLNIVGADWASGVAAGNFTLDKGLTVASINRDSDSQVTLTLTDGQKLADGTYTITVDNAATTKNAAINQHITSGKVVLEIRSNGYKLESAGYTFSIAGGSYSGGTTANVTVTSGLADYEKLAANGVTTTESDVTINVTGDNTFTLTAPAITSAKTIRLSIEKANKVKELTVAKLTASPLTKVYDGTDAAPAGFAVTVTDKYAAKGDVTIEFTGATFDKKDTTATEIRLTGATVTDTGSGDAAFYSVPDTLTFTGASITEATINSITVAPIDDTKGTTKDAIVAAIKDSGVTVATAGGATLPTGDDTLTVADVFGTNLDTKLGELVDAALIGEGIVTSTEATVDLTSAADGDSVNAPAVKKGDTIKFTIPADAEADSLTVTPTDATNYTVADGVVTVGLDAADTAETITVSYTDKDGNPVSITVTVAAPAAAEPDYDSADGKTLGITIADTDYADGDFTDTFSDNYAELNPTVAIGPFNVTVKKVATPPPAGGFGVTFNTRDYGEADSTYVQADSEGKITTLPKMNKVVKGAQFNGWSKDGTEAGKVDIGTLVVDDNIELFAWFEGYMNGYGYAAKRPVKPTASVTRGELLKMLLVASGEYDGEADYSGTTKFTDGNGQWYTPYLICAEQSGKTIIEGYGDGTFRANRPVTRYEAAKMIAGAFGVDVDPNGTASELKDFANIPDWAKEFVAALYNNGTVDGRNDGAYHGDDNIQRCEAAKMINIYLGLDDASKDAITQSAQIENPFTDISKSHWAYAEVMFASLSVPASYYSYDLTMPSGR